MMSTQKVSIPHCLKRSTSANSRRCSVASMWPSDFAAPTIARTSVSSNGLPSAAGCECGNTWSMFAGTAARRGRHSLALIVLVRLQRDRPERRRAAVAEETAAAPAPFAAEQHPEQPTRNGASGEGFRARRGVELADRFSAGAARVAGRGRAKTCSRSCFGSIIVIVLRSSTAPFDAVPALKFASAGGRGPPVAQSSSSTVCTTGMPAPARELRDATDVARRDDVGAACARCVASLRSRKRCRDLGLQNVVSARRAAAEVPFRRSPSRANPAAASSARGGCSTFCPCCIEHAE